MVSRLASTTVILAISFASIVVGAELYARFVFLKLLDSQPAFSSAIAEENCFPFNESARADIERTLQSPAAFAPTGFRNTPNATWIGSNAAGQEWITYTNFEGARVSSGEAKPVSTKDSEILVYGDSFAAAAEVNYEDAWYSSLHDLGRMANFGIYGGAPDQALAYLQHHLSDGFRPKIVLIQMITENVNRLPNIYHCFLYPSSSMRSVLKPHYIVDKNGDAVLRPSPRSVADWTSNVLEEDFWGWRLVLLRRIRLAGGGLESLAPFIWNQDALSDPYVHLLKSDYTRSVLQQIIKQFSQLARQYEFHPYFMILPTRGDELHNTASLEFVRGIESTAKLSRVGFIDGFRLVEEVNVRKNFQYNILPNEGHMSVTANSIIAAGVAKSLGRKTSARPAESMPSSSIVISR
jgi:hypothetical protein